MTLIESVENLKAHLKTEKMREEIDRRIIELKKDAERDLKDNPDLKEELS